MSTPPTNPIEEDQLNTTNLTTVYNTLQNEFDILNLKLKMSLKEVLISITLVLSTSLPSLTTKLPKFQTKL